MHVEVTPTERNRSLDAAGAQRTSRDRKGHSQFGQAVRMRLDALLQGLQRRQDGCRPAQCTKVTMVTDVEEKRGVTGVHTPVLQILSMKHQQVLSPHHVELQVTRLLQTRRHKAQQLLHIHVRK